MTVAIRIESVSKQYRLGTVGTGTMAHDLNRWWAQLRGKEDPYAKVGQVNKRDQAADSEYVWALKDINLEVEQGEVLGIIGANGAGKSTLLKIISRITSPTSGAIRAKGRVASLLEVGTGMHEEMTARENVYLNGAILGMRRHEITAKFDDIIDFAGCRMYVDTPVKRYSSGMRVRLGFAVAAFLEPEILIVDEVLAVGDAEFQQRAIGKMQAVSADSGRTILFVSHNMAALKALCKQGLVLHAGQQASATVPINDAVAAYVNRAKRVLQDSKEKKNNVSEIIKNIRVVSGDVIDVDRTFASKDFSLSIDYELSVPVADLQFAVAIETQEGIRVAWLTTAYYPIPAVKNRPVKGTVCITIHEPNLSPGVYHLTVACTDGNTTIDILESCKELTVLDADVFGTGRSLFIGRAPTWCKATVEYLPKC